MQHRKVASAMSALGQKQTSRPLERMSALPPKADIYQHGRDVRFTLESGHHGSLAIFAAIRRASSVVSSSAADRRPSSSSK